MHAVWQLPDRDIDARHETDDGADDRARDGKRVVAAKERHEEQHEGGIGKRGKQDQREHL